MKGMDEMNKRKKDSGFTLIELMIVIAVIGILAVVLVPKVGTVKTQAKAAGVDTNMRAVQGYVQSKINGWANEGKTITEVNADIIATFTTEKIPNPYTSTLVVADDGAAATADPLNNALFLLDADVAGADVTAAPNAAKTKGTIVLSLTDDADGTVTSIKLIPHDDTGTAITGKTITITP